MPVEKLKILKKEASQPALVVGICAALDYYRMAYFFGKSFEKNPNKFEITEIKNYEKLTAYKIEIDECRIFLVKNRLLEGLFFKKAPLADYLVIVFGADAQLIIERLKKELNTVGAVQSIFAIEDRFLSKTKLMYFEQT